MTLQSTIFRKFVSWSQHAKSGGYLKIRKIYHYQNNFHRAGIRGKKSGFEYSATELGVAVINMHTKFEVLSRSRDILGGTKN